MTVSHIFDNVSTSIWSAQSAGGSGLVVGSAFTPATSMYANGIRWYRTHTGTGRAPTGLAIYNATTQAQVSGSLIASPTDSGAVGWQESVFSTPVPLAGNQQYRVVGVWPVSATYGIYNATLTFTPGSGISTPYPNIRVYVNGTVLAYPSNLDNAVAAVDVTLDTTNLPSTVPVTNTDIGNALYSWLVDGSDNQHVADGLPVHIKNAVDAVAAQASTIGADVGSVLSDVAPLAGKIGTVTSGDVTTYGLRGADLVAGVIALLGLAGTAAGHISSLVTIAGAIKDLLPGGGGSAPTVASAAAVAALATALGDVANTANIAYDLGRWASGDVLLPGALTSQATHDFNGADVWVSGYGVHRCTITATLTGQGSKALANGVIWYPRLGSWAPVMPDGALGERKFLEFSDQWLWPVPRGARGVAIFTYPGNAGTLEAYIPT